jgi:hypothetical protein
MLCGYDALYALLLICAMRYELLQLKHGLDEAARGAKSGCKKSY